jgi:hypothetical protein
MVKQGTVAHVLYSLRRELDDGPPVHFYFCKTHPRVSVLLRLAPWHQKSNRVLPSRAPRPSTPSLDVVRSSAAACSLAEGGGPLPLGLPRRGPSTVPPDSACPLPPPPLVDPARSSTLARGNKATPPLPQQKHQHLTPVHLDVELAPVHHLDAERHHLLPASHPRARALAPLASSSRSSTAKSVLASPRPSPVTKNQRRRHPSVTDAHL